MADKITNFLSTLSPDTISKIINLAPGGAVNNTVPDYSSIQPNTFQIQPTVPPSFDSQPIMIAGIIITIIIIFWYLIKISIKFTIDDQKTKETFEYIDTFLFGNTGLLTNLFVLWVVLIAGISIYDIIDYFVVTTTNFTPTFKTLPSFIDKIVALIKSVKSLYSVK